MRTVALLRVVLFHVTGIDALSLVASMPVMFFVAGALFARSMQNRRGWVVVRDRYRRILPSLMVFASALVALYASLGLLTGSFASVPSSGPIEQLGLYDTARLFFPLLSGEPPVGPGTVDQAVYWTWNPLWYVHTHLVLALLGPLLVLAYRRWPRGALVAVGLLWMLDAIANEGHENTITFLVFFIGGFAFTDGRLLRVPRATMRRATFVTAAIGVAFIPLGPGLGINVWAPSLAFVGAAWVAGCIVWRDQLEKVAVGRVARPLISFVNRRALTIYLWSMAGIYISRTLFPVEGGILRLSWIAIVSVMITTAVILVACVLMGWIEDLAARRSPEWWPGRGSAARA
jgi:peptidoglycan/LPS O-acetylase OafA/YrhL